MLDPAFAIRLSPSMRKALRPQTDTGTVSSKYRAKPTWALQPTSVYLWPEAMVEDQSAVDEIFIFGRQQ